MADRYTKEQRKTYNRMYTEKRRTMVRKLLGGRCFECGSTSDLHFHHRDAATKEFPVSRFYKTKLDILLAEVAKCVLLCGSCHRTHHSHGELAERFMAPA